MKSKILTLSGLDKQQDYDPASLPVERARELIRQFLAPIAEKEAVNLRTALHRILAADVLSPMNVPPHDYSAMDGYAVSFSDLSSFRVVGSSYAGHPFAGEVAAGECVRIMTGALIPVGCDSVVMQEHVVLDGEIGRAHV